MSEVRQLLTTLIRTEAENPRHSVRVIAEQIRTTESDLVDEWLLEHRDLLFSEWVSDILRWERIGERRRSSVIESVEALAAGISLFDLSYSVNDDNLRMTLGEMRGTHHLYVAESYKQESHRSKLYAELHRQMADKVGLKLTRTVYTETELRGLFAEYEEKK